MANGVTRRFIRIDDATVLQLMDQLAQVFPDTEATINVLLFQGLNVPLVDLPEDLELVGKYQLEQVTLSISLEANTSFSATFRRSIKSESNGLVASSQFNEIDTHFGRDAGHWRNRLSDVTRISKIIGSIGAIDTTSSSGDTELLNELIVGLAAQHRSMLDKLDQKVAELDDKRAELQNEFDKKEEERTKKYKEQLDAVNQEREKLQLQSHMSERRRLLGEMIDEKSSNLRKNRVPAGAIRARWGVFFATIALGVAAALLSYASIRELNQIDSSAEALLTALTENYSQSPSESDSTQQIRSQLIQQLVPTNWFLMARSILSSLIAAGAFIYAANWMRGFYYSELRSSKEIDQYNYDLARASWVIETILEVQHEQKGTVPEAWVDGVTRGLFRTNGAATEDSDASNALRALMGYSASASFGPEGPKFDLSKRDARRLARDAGSGSD